MTYGDDFATPLTPGTGTIFSKFADVSSLGRLLCPNFFLNLRLCSGILLNVIPSVYGRRMLSSSTVSALLIPISDTFVRLFNFVFFSFFFVFGSCLSFSNLITFTLLPFELLIFGAKDSSCWLEPLLLTSSSMCLLSLSLPFFLFFLSFLSLFE